MHSIFKISYFIKYNNISKWIFYNVFFQYQWFSATYVVAQCKCKHLLIFIIFIFNNTFNQLPILFNIVKTIILKYL